jgi:hypothetical protein
LKEPLGGYEGSTRLKTVPVISRILYDIVEVSRRL